MSTSAWSPTAPGPLPPLLARGHGFRSRRLARLSVVQAGGCCCDSSGALVTGGNADFRGAFSAGSREVLGPVRADPAWTLELGPGDTGADRRLELRREWPLGVGWRGERDSQAVVRRAERRPAGRRPGADLRAGSRGRAASEAPCPGSANHDQRPVGRAGGPGPHVGLPGHRRARRLARPKNRVSCGFEVEAWKPRMVDGKRHPHPWRAASRAVWQPAAQPQTPRHRDPHGVDRAASALSCVRLSGRARGPPPAVSPLSCRPYAAIRATGGARLGALPPLMLPTDPLTLWSAILANRIPVAQQRGRGPAVTIRLDPRRAGGRRGGAAASQLRSRARPPHRGSVEAADRGGVVS